MQQSDITTAVRDFVHENFLFRLDREMLADDESLIEANIIDSTGVLELISFLETNFGVSIVDSDIVPADLDSIGAIAAFVSRKLEPEAVTASHPAPV